MDFQDIEVLGITSRKLFNLVLKLNTQSQFMKQETSESF